MASAASEPPSDVESASGQTHAPHEGGEARIGAQVVQIRIRGEKGHAGRPLGEGLLEAGEGALDVAERGMGGRQVIRRDVRLAESFWNNL